VGFFLENFSENQSKKRRGRPPLLPYELIAPSSDWSKRRGTLNDLHLGIALNALYPEDDEQALGESYAHYAWLFDGTNLFGTRFKKTILVELGRLRDPALIRVVADVICKRKMKTSVAIPYLRRLRSKGDKVGDIDGLTGEITELIDDYMRRYRGTKWETVLEALNNAYCAVSEAQRIQGLAGTH
jgi:hypothetical protein